MTELLIDFTTSVDGYAAEGCPVGWVWKDPSTWHGWDKQPERDYIVLMGAGTRFDNHIPASAIELLLICLDDHVQCSINTSGDHGLGNRKS